MLEIKPFVVDIPQQQLDELRLRLSLTRYPERETVADWSQGVPLDYLRELADYWQDGYDLRRLETRLNALPQYLATCDDLDIHFIHVRSPSPHARPLVLTHGWPGSVVEFLKVIGPLSDPAAHGGNPADAFHVVCPSLPGYGFSDKPAATGWDVVKIASTWSRLMAALGYPRYFAQGGDWGCAVTSSIAQQDPGCLGIHLNMATVRPNQDQLGELTTTEHQAMVDMKYYQDWDSGYAKLQATRPQTLGYGLVDSPVGQLAWIVEKFWAWTDCNGHPENALTKEEMLDNVMMYWLNAAAASSARLYWQSFASFIVGEVDTPTGFTVFPKEIFRSSRRWCANTYKNIHYWNEAEKGGHFAAFEQPEIFVAEVRDCFRSL